MPRSVEERFTQLEGLLRQRSVRLTAARRLVAKRAVAFLHFTAEQLVKDVRRADSSIGRATVYRTLALLQDMGAIEKHDFRYGPPNYELTFAKTHHDHLMCVTCGEIIEFKESRVEQLQDEVLHRYGYQLLAHAYKIYGFCGKCQKAQEKARWVRHAPPQLHVEEVVA